MTTERNSVQQDISGGVMILEMRQRCMERHTDEDDKLFDIGFFFALLPPSGEALFGISFFSHGR